MDKSKMSGTDNGYGDDIHRLVEGIEVPNDDSITISSFENSQMTYSKSLNQTKRTSKRNNDEGRGNMMQQFRHQDEDYRIPNNYAEATLSIESVNSSPRNRPTPRREEYKHANSPEFDKTLNLDSSQDDNNYMSRNLGRRGNADRDEYDNYQSINYGNNSLDEQMSPSFKQRLPITETSRYNNGTYTTEFVNSTIRSDEDDYEDFGEDSEESEYEDSEDEQDGRRGMRRTHESSEENHSLAEHTTTQFIGHKDLTEAFHRQSLGNTTQEEGHTYDRKTFSDEGESEEEESDDYFIESQVSGIDSLSQTYKSKVSSTHQKKNEGYNRKNKSRMTGKFPNATSSQFNDTASARDTSRQHDPSESIGVRTRKGLGDETLSCDQSNESWGAVMHKDALIAPRDFGGARNEHRLLQSPNGRSLIIDESMSQERVAAKASQGTDQNYSRSNMYENSDKLNPKTAERRKRQNNKLNKAKKTRAKNKNNSLIRASGNLPRDQELEYALTHGFMDNKNHIVLGTQEVKNTDAFLNTDSDEDERKLEDIELQDYRKLRFENKRLKSQVAQLTIISNSQADKLSRYEEELTALNNKIFEEERNFNDVADQLHYLRDKMKGVSQHQLADLKKEKLSRARKEIELLKKQNNMYEKENDKLRSNLNDIRSIEESYLNEMNKLDIAIRKYQIKEQHLLKNEHIIKDLRHECKVWETRFNDLVNQANQNIGELEDQKGEYQVAIQQKNRDIEKLQKQINDNQHLLTQDDHNYRQHLDEINELKDKLKEVTNELEEYKMFSKTNPMGTKVDLDKELQKKDQLYKNKLQSAHQQIDEWKNKFKDADQKCVSLQKQIRILESNFASRGNNSSTAIIDQSQVTETLERIRELLKISDEDDILNELEKLLVDVEANNLLKEEYEKLQKLYQKSKTEQQQLLTQKSENEMTEYTQGLLTSKNEEIEYLNRELGGLKGKCEELENMRWEINHEKNTLVSRVNELQRVIRDRETEIGRLRKVKEEGEVSYDEIKATAKEFLVKNKELEAKLKELEKQDDFEKSKSMKESEHLTKESNSLLSFILSLEFAYDEEFDRLFKNQSYANEFDQARKHLENQKDVVSSVIDRLTKELESQSTQVTSYKNYIDELESKVEDVDQLKSESTKWKQSYERLAITLKNTQGNGNKEMDTILADYEKLQNSLADLKLEATQKSKDIKDKEGTIERLQIAIKENEKKIKELQNTIESLKHENLTESSFVNTQNTTLILKLEKDNKNLENQCDSLKKECERLEKVVKDLQEKHQSSLEKISKLTQTEAAVKSLEKENTSLRDQITALNKVTAENKSIFNEPVEMMSTINSLKSNLEKKEVKIKELNAEIKLLNSLLDEARLEIRNNDDSESRESEHMSFTDALEMLDSIVAKPLGISSTNKSQEFSAILKRAQMIKEQCEDPIVHKIVTFMRQYFTPEVLEREKQCKKTNDYKQFIIDTCNTIRDEHRVSFDEANEMLDISTDSKNMRRPYGYKDAYIDISFVFDTFTDTYKSLCTFEARQEKEQCISSLKQEHEANIEELSNEFYVKFEEDRKQLVAKFKAEKETEFKAREEKILKDFEVKRVKMYEQFEALKNEFQDQFTEQSKKYQDISEEETSKQREELEKQKALYEKEFEERLQRKTNALEGMFNTRKHELEDEFNLKKQRLEFEMKTKAETQDFKNKTELESIVSKYETQAEEKIKRIQNEADMKLQDFEEQLKQKDDEIKKIKLDHEKKLKEQKKAIDREFKFKSETCERESKIKVDRETKKHKEVTEDFENKIKDLEAKIAEEKKRHKELTKSNAEKHKAEIKNLKNTHENELVRKKIEIEKESKKAKRDLEIEIENLKKEHEVEVMEKLLQQKKELNNAAAQKLKLEKTKHEKEMLEKETELNQKFSETEIELHKKHEEEVQKLKDTLAAQHQKLLNAALENVKAEFKEQCQQEFSEKLQCEAEKLKSEYQTENHNLKLKLQEYSETQSVASSCENRMYNFDMVCKENESVQTEEIMLPINYEEMNQKKLNKDLRFSEPFDYEQMKKDKIETGTQIDSDDDSSKKPPKSVRSIKHAQSTNEIVEALKADKKREMDTLQHRYELRITELLEAHMEEITETKNVTTVVTIRKLERILILELDKMCQAIMAKSREEAMERNVNANMLISQLVTDLTQDNSTTENLERIKKKLNEVLVKYKQKVDFKVKHKFEQDLVNERKKLQQEYERMRQELEAQRVDSPSVLDTGVERAELSEKRIRRSIANKDFADFTKEYRLCDKKVYEQNILTRVCPVEGDKTIIVDLGRIVSDLNMVKNSLAACARQLGFTLLEPHKISEDDFQEQMDPNIPEPVYTISQQYRHLLNTFLRFSRDVVVNAKGEQSSNCFKEEEENVKKHKQEVMGLQLQLSDFKDKLRKLEREHKLLQGVYQNHLESRLQIIDFNDYDIDRMLDDTKECVDRIKKTHRQLMELQTLFLRHGNDMDAINEECEEYIRTHGEDENNVTYNNIEFDASYPQDKFDQLKRRTFDHKSRNDRNSNEFGIRNTNDLTNYTAQLPRATNISGSNTARESFVSPKFSRNAPHGMNRGSTESTKTPYLLNSENVQSTAKPPKFKRDPKTIRSPMDSVHLKSREYLQERSRINQPNKSLERRNSFDHFNINHTRNNTGLGSTQSVQNFSKFIEPHSLDDSDDKKLSKAQENMNNMLKSFLGNMNQLGNKKNI